MRFYTRTHKHYCGVDLHARSMYVCVLDQEGNVLVSQNIASAPQPFLELIAPYREDLAVAAECMFTWYWLADVCAREGIVFVLGHALYMRAIHDGKAKNDRIDAHKIAALLRGGMLPQAYVYPQAMRATRDLMRRRNYLMRRRAELLAHITNTNHQYNLTALGVRPARPAERSGLLEHFAEPQVRRSIAADLSLIEHYDRELPALERYLESNAQAHDPLALAIVRTIHGMGQVLGWVDRMSLCLEHAATVAAMHIARQPSRVGWTRPRQRIARAPCRERSLLACPFPERGTNRRGSTRSEPNAIECAGKGLKSFPGRRAQRATTSAANFAPASDPR